MFKYMHNMLQKTFSNYFQEIFNEQIYKYNTHHIKIDLFLPGVQS